MPDLALTVQIESTYAPCIIHSFMAVFSPPKGLYSFDLLEKGLKTHDILVRGRAFKSIAAQNWLLLWQPFLTAMGVQDSQHPDPDLASYGSPRCATSKAHQNGDISLSDCYFLEWEFSDNIWYFGIFPVTSRSELQKLARAYKIVI